MVKGKSREYFHSSKRVSVNTLRYDFKKYIEPFVDDVSKFGMHSLVPRSTPLIGVFQVTYWIYTRDGSALL